MKLNVLGCFGGDLKGRFPAFLIEDRYLLDAGTIGSALTVDAQQNIRIIALTHSHVDHLIGIPFFLDAVYLKSESPVVIMGTGPVLENLHTHLINDVIWPDFTALPTRENPIVMLRNVALDEEIPFGDSLFITPIATCHTASSCGYIVRDERSCLVYTGDIGPCPEFWSGVDRYLGMHPAIDPVAILVECSFPNRLGDFARATGHLTADMLRNELGNGRYRSARILIFHMKPQYMTEIEEELARIPECRIELMQPDQEYHF